MDGNEDEAQGNVNEGEGRGQEAWRDLTGELDAPGEGEADQAKGRGEQFTGDVKNPVHDLTN